MSYVKLLAEVPIFKNLVLDDLERLSQLLKRKCYAKNEVIFHQGDVGTALFIVCAGEVVIRLSSPEGKEVTLTALRRGDSFGELSLLDGAPRSADAVASSENTELLYLDREDFQRFLRERPQVPMSLLAMLAGTVRRVTQLVHDAAFLDARARLARVLLSLAETQGKTGPEGVVLPKRTQTELAKLCGITRESVNRWLRFYVQQKVLTYKKSRITLLDLAALRRDVDKPH